MEPGPIYRGVNYGWQASREIARRIRDGPSAETHRLPLPVIQVRALVRLQPRLLTLQLARANADHPLEFFQLSKASDRGPGHPWCPLAGHLLIQSCALKRRGAQALWLHTTGLSVHDCCRSPRPRGEQQPIVLEAEVPVRSAKSLDQILSSVRENDICELSGRSAIGEVYFHCI